MSRMYRITLQKMLVLLRLVIVTSLAGYSMPAASATMHGSWSDMSIVKSDHHGVANDTHSHGDHVSSSDASQKMAKRDCCKGFCASMAITTGTSAVAGPHVASIREFIDDARALGEIPSLHRPPNI